MGREVSVYQLEKNKIAVELHEFLEADDAFRKFMIRRANDYGTSYELNYEALIEKVSKGLKGVNGNELFEIIYFIEEEIGAKLGREVEASLSSYGVYKIYQSQTKSEADLFILQYSNYVEEILELRSKRKIPGQKDQLIPADFSAFLNYMILFSDRLIQLSEAAQSIEYAEIETPILKGLRSKLKSDSQIEKLIERELKLIKEEENRRQQKTTSHPKYYGWTLLMSCTKMKDLLKEKGGSVLIINSV